MGNVAEASPYYLALLTGSYGDELVNYSTNVTLQQLYTNSLNSVDAQTNRVWTSAYNFIYQANAVIEGVQASSGINEGVKHQLTGEALFLRAYWHFYLTNLYGKIPIVTSTLYKENAVAVRDDKVKVYEQIVKDLLSARLVLGDTYVGNDNISLSTERIRPNKFVVDAFLARVYLYMEKYEEAELASTRVINNKSQFDIIDADKVFLKNSKESIWQIMTAAPNTNLNTTEGAGFILTLKPQNSAAGSTAVSPRLLNSFTSADKRKTIWIAKFTDKTVTPM
ncbi:RagB/SusD family nutrient uptake outer membrane protein [Chitinophaga sedimenti]|nr:RagB/SusD family nutrient uptake outer membrane protein [Chitinophaga sedimenti]